MSHVRCFNFGPIISGSVHVYVQTHQVAHPEKRKRQPMRVSDVLHIIYPGTDRQFSYPPLPFRYFLVVFSDVELEILGCSLVALMHLVSVGVHRGVYIENTYIHIQVVIASGDDFLEKRGEDVD